MVGKPPSLGESKSRTHDASHGPRTWVQIQESHDDRKKEIVAPKLGNPYKCLKNK